MVESGRGHTAVLLPQVLAALNIRASGAYLDATLGRGGHAEAILEKLTLDGRMLCLDRDPVAIAEAKARLGTDSRVTLFLAPFSALEACADAVEPRLKLDGILFDLGVSSPQLDDSERGFSFMQDGPLDMRMSRRGNLRRRRRERRIGGRAVSGFFASMARSASPGALRAPSSPIASNARSRARSSSPA